MNTDSRQVLLQADRLYHVKPIHQITMGNSGNIIFEVQSEQRHYILRISEYSQSKKVHLEFESHWTEYLAARIEGVAKPIRSVNGKLYEVIEVGDKMYLLYLQEKARGKIVDINNPSEFNEVLFFNLGALMGQMHRLTISYEGNVIQPEFEWDGPHNWRKDITILDKGVRQGEKRLLKELSSLPIDKDNYGIVHFDIHTDNFLVEDNRITLIDFGACQLNWYAADIASAIFFMIQKGVGPLKQLTEKSRTEFAEAYLISYLNGYLQTNSLNEYWIYTFDTFMKYQMIDEYIFAQDYWPQGLSHLRQWYMNWHKDRITNNIPYVSIDYKKVVNSVPGISSV